MTVHTFISAKRDGQKHAPGDVAAFVREVVGGSIPDYQVSAWLMAAFINGLDMDETAELALAMADSGQRLLPESLPKPVIDKHSTGGVGDATTLLFLPIMAACGVPVVKMSGRGLGFTGGTLDKLESIPGFRTDLTPAELVAQAREVGCALAGQTADLAPADKILYALRDATETVASVPLVAASVMSKKLAAGADIIVLDVKCGNGAFAKSLPQARELGRTMKEIGVRASKKVRALITDMNQPLAPAVGNALEVAAAIHELKSGCSGRLGRVALALCKAALDLAEKNADPEHAVSSGAALKKMREWFAAQGGDARIVENPELLPQANVTLPLKAAKSGIVQTFATELIGETVRELGAGRMKKEDSIIPSVGIEVFKSIGDEVVEGEPLMLVHARNAAEANVALDKLADTIVVGDESVQRPPPVIEIV